MPFRDTVSGNTAPCVHDRQSHGGLAEIGQADSQGGKIHGFGQALQVDPQRTRVGSRCNAARGIHSADHDHGASKFCVGKRLEDLRTLPVIEHQIDGHAVEATVLDFCKRLRAACRKSCDMTREFRGLRDQGPLGGIVFDDQKPKRATFARERFT